MTAPIQPRRRTVVRGAAWATPAIAAAAATPAYAASPCTTTACPNISFGAVTGTGRTGSGAEAAGNGWIASPFPGTWSNRGPSNPVGFRAETNGDGMTTSMGSWFAATAEPSTVDQTITLTQTGQPALARGCAYRVRFGVVTWQASTTPLTLQVLVGGTSIGEYKTLVNQPSGYGDRGYQTFNVPSTASGMVSFRFVFGNSVDHGDIKLYNPSVICG